MFSSDADAPAGYITMTAGDILRGAQALVDDRRAGSDRWNEALPGRLAAWARGLSWWRRLCLGVPRKEEEMARWWNSFEWSFQRPSIPGLPDRPYLPSSVGEWVVRARRLPSETKVFINVDDGATFTLWGAQSKGTES